MPAADRLIQSLVTAPIRLRDHPHLGQKLPGFAPRNIRRLLIGQHEMRYEVRGRDRRRAEALAHAGEPLTPACGRSTTGIVMSHRASQHPANGQSFTHRAALQSLRISAGVFRELRVQRHLLRRKAWSSEVRSPSCARSMISAQRTRCRLRSEAASWRGLAGGGDCTASRWRFGCGVAGVLNTAPGCFAAGGVGNAAWAGALGWPEVAALSGVGATGGTAAWAGSAGWVAGAELSDAGAAGDTAAWAGSVAWGAGAELSGTGAAGDTVAWAGSPG